MRKQAFLGLFLTSVLTFSACDVGDLFRKKKEYYECTVEFYVSPAKVEVEEDADALAGTYNESILDNMAKLLSSEDFTEYLMLNGEVVPRPGVWTVGKDSQDVSSEVNSGISLANTEIESVNDMYFELSVEEDVTEESYRELLEIWNREVANSGVDSDYRQYSEDAYNVLYEQGSLSVAVQAAHTDYMECQAHLQQTKEVVEAAVEASQKKMDEALALWRTTNEYQTQFEQYAAGVSYTYQVVVKDEEERERSALYAEISVKEDESLAAKLLSRLLNHLPAYVQENMVINPEEYVGTYCIASTNFHEIEKVRK